MVVVTIEDTELVSKNESEGKTSEGIVTCTRAPVSN